MPAGMNAPKDWPAEPVRFTTIDPDGRPFSPRAARHVVAEQRADGALGVADRQVDRDLTAVGDHILRALDQRHVEVLVELVQLRRGCCGAARRRRTPGRRAPA